MEERYRVRHEIWAQEFLAYLYKERFKNKFWRFDVTYEIKNMIQRILNNVDFNDLLNILNSCTSLFHNERLVHIGKVVFDNFIVPDELCNDEKAMIWNNKGFVFTALRDYVQAIECFDKAIEIDPHYIKAWNNKGNALAEMGYYDQAICCFDKILGFDPYYSTAWSNKSNALNNLGRYEEAIKCCDKAIEIDRSQLRRCMV